MITSTNASRLLGEDNEDVLGLETSAVTGTLHVLEDKFAHGLSFSK